MDRPHSNEYVSYYQQYINRVPDGNIITILENQLQDTLANIGNSFLE